LGSIIPINIDTLQAIKLFDYGEKHGRSSFDQKKKLIMAAFTPAYRGCS
jgi:hypothetical protein